MPPTDTATPQIHIASIQAGKPVPLPWKGSQLVTGIVKHPVTGPARVSRQGLAGDGQADLRHHGGPSKALCVHPEEHYEHWSELLGDPDLPSGALGENLTTRGALEADVCIGDIWAVGTTLLQVTQPRRPCYRLAARFGNDQLAPAMQRTGRTGYYLRVLQPGSIRAGAVMTLVERRNPHVSVAEANRVMHHDRHDLDGISTLLALPDLPASWRISLQRRVAGRDDDSDQARLTGTPTDSKEPHD
ncbi:MOSC domain-containing protein [Streptomyces sp. NPDC002133]|uniref:MOSC domain-containing protein n=1 Tax=Streptomyces sp. NPDC002133 TaxID=3154409 RepID=UPI0033271AB4